MIHLKEQAIKAIRKLPDTATVDDIIYQVYFIAQVEAGMNDVREGRVVSHEEAKKRMRKWLEK
jgi:predicted transcriptional regulator